MDRATEQELVEAWRALAGEPTGDGWRTIPVAVGGTCKLRAGRHFPGNEEALLVFVGAAHVPPIERLPSGRGFFVSNATINEPLAVQTWIAFHREKMASRDLFTWMATDIVTTLNALCEDDDERVVQVFISRIRAWQDFMQRGTEGVLGSEAEVGLFGELEMLLAIVNAGLPVRRAIEAWCGPLGGLQDFRLGTGAIEVKTTVASRGFSANIGALEQLDDSLVQPLYIGAIRLALCSQGRTLPALIDDIRTTLLTNPVTLSRFNDLLLHAGFIDALVDRYVRRLSRVEMVVIPVADGFPRLTRATVNSAIRHAQYDIDIDLTTHCNVALPDALYHCGAI